MRKLLIVALTFLAVIGFAFGAGSTPIAGLKLIGNVDGNLASITNLDTLAATTVTATTVKASSVLLVSGTNVTTATTKGYVDSATNGVFTTLGSTTAGTEGIKLIGSLGGYILDEFFEDTYLRGPSRDKPTFVYAGPSAFNLAMAWSDGDVYDPVYGYYHLNSGSNSLTDNAVNYAYWNSSNPNVVQWTTTSPNINSNIVLGVFSCSLGTIMQGATTEAVGDMPLQMRAGASAIAPSLVVNGLEYYATGTSLSNIAKTAGVEYHDMKDRLEHPAQNLSDSSLTIGILTYAHTNVGMWGWAITNQVPVGMWDDGTNKIACTSSNWYKGLFLSFAGSPLMAYIYPQAAYTSAVDAVAGPDPTLPPGFTPYVPLCTEYVFLGTDTVLRTESQYWVDRRFQIRRPGTSSVTVSGGTAVIPSLDQVMLKGSSLGGILPHDAGAPSDDDQLSNKGYVDSTRNKASTGTAYVDSINGDDGTGQIEKSSLPFKTIQAAIDACAVVATDTRRFLIAISIGTYAEDVTMKNYIGIRGLDIESTIIRGQVSYPSTYDDPTGGEITTLSIFTTNKPAVVIDQGSDESYGGIRSCALYTTWTNDTALKPTVQISRGIFEVYGTTWVQTDNSGNSGSNVSCLYYGTTNSSNLGAYHLVDFAGSHTMNVADTNDTVSIAYVDTVQNSVMSMVSCDTEIDLSDSTNHANKVKLAYQNGGNSSIDIKGCTPTVTMSSTNNCILIAAASENTPTLRLGGGVHYNSCRVRAPNIKAGNSFHSSSPTALDYAEVYWTAIAPQTGVYPARYTVDGIAGVSGYVLAHGLGDVLVGGGIDLSSDNPSILTPASGHLQIHAQVTSGLENPYFRDSTGLDIRLGRDEVKTLYNAEATTLTKGEAVFIYTGISGTANYVKRAKADSLSTMPAIGFVMSTSIAAGAKGRVQCGGRLESGIDTSYCTAGDKLYLSATTAGRITNVEPTTAYSQLIGWANVIGTNGSVQVRPYKPDTLGNQLPSYYASQSGLSSATNAINALGTTQIVVKAALDGFTNSVNNIGTALGGFTNQVSNIGTALGGFTNSVNALGATQIVVKVALSGFTNQVNSLGGTQIVVKAALDGFTNSVNNIGTALSVFTNSVNALGYTQIVVKAALNGFTNQVNAIGATQIVVIAALNGFTNSVNALGSTQVVVKAALNGLTNRIVVLEGVVDPAVCFGRLTLDSDLAITTNDQLTKTVLYFLPYGGSSISLYVAGSWNIYTFTSCSNLMSSLTTNKNYDVFAAYVNGAVTNELLAWTSGNVRATALALQDGVYVKSGDASRKYIGTIRTLTNATVYCEDSVVKRFVWNQYNKKMAALIRTTGTASWTYGTTTWRLANNISSNIFEFICGIPEENTKASGVVSALSGGGGRYASLGIGVNSTTAPFGRYGGAGGANADMVNLYAECWFMPLTGYNYASWLEYANGSLTFYGISTTSTAVNSGIGMMWVH